MVAGGTESPICRISLAGFAACKALSTQHNDDPLIASRPYDRDRDGFVMGEGAGIVVLEELDHALSRRGAKILAEVVGYGLSGDAFHITAPSEEGDGAYRCMKMALKRAGLEPGDIDYINAHGTSTMADTIELGASSVWWAIPLEDLHVLHQVGHRPSAGCGRCVEAIFSALAIRDNIAPPTLNLDNPDVDTRIDLVPHTARKREINVALSNSFGFGGTNASLVLKRYS